jgi:chromate transporter
VIANLAVTFGVVTLFATVRSADVLGGEMPVPDWSSLDAFALAVAVAAFVAIWRFRWHVVPVIVASAVAGLLVKGLA